MKRLLYGTTALVAVGTLMAGPANAAGFEASLHGYMEQWFGFSNQDADKTGGAGSADINNNGFVSDSEVHFDAIATLDNGLKVQYHVELEGNVSGSTTAPFVFNDQIDESYLRLTANWGQVIFGSENSAMYLMGYGPDSYGETLLSGDSTNWIARHSGGGAGMFRTPIGSANIEVDSSCNDDKKLTYFTPRFSGFQFGASYTADCGSQDTNGLGNEAGAGAYSGIETYLALGANFKRKFDQVDVAVSAGYGHANKPKGNPGNDPEALIFGAHIGFGAFTLGGYWGKYLDAVTNAGGTTSQKNRGWAIGGAYHNGPWGISVTYLNGEREGLVADSSNDNLDAVEVGAKYALGPGVELRGSIYYANWDSETSEQASATANGNEGWAVTGGMKIGF